MHEKSNLPEVVLSGRVGSHPTSRIPKPKACVTPYSLRILASSRICWATETSSEPFVITSY